MKIVYCILDCSYTGGTERTLAVQANYFAESGHEVHIVTTEKPIRNHNSYHFSDKIWFTNLDINYREVDFKSSPTAILKKIKKNRLHKKKLETLLITLKVDFVITLYGHELSFLHKIQDSSKKIIEFHFSRNYKSIENKHNTSIYKKGFSLLKEYRKRLFIANYHAFVVLSKEDAADWKEARNIHVIPNAIPFIPSKIAECTNKKIISVGRLTYQKGYDRLVEAWKLIAARHPDWELNIYGAGEDKDILIEKIESYGLSTSMKINPPTERIEDKYVESSIYVMSSRYEGFPMVLIEAMACGLPCISFACPCGPSEIIEDGKNGYIVPNDEVRLLAEKIQQLIEDEGKRTTMGYNAKQSMKYYSVKNIMSKWNDLFVSLLKSNKIA